jgi:hypothetical protein
VKTNNSNRQNDYLRFLRQQRFSILSMQETHANADTIPSIEKQLHASQYIQYVACDIPASRPPGEVAPIYV